MTVENAFSIDQLDFNNPADTDPKAEGARHIRMIKATLKATFNGLVGFTGVTKRLLDALGVTQPYGTNNDLPASTEFVQTALLNQTVSAQLPGQSGNAGKVLGTNGSTASWTSAVLTSGGTMTGTLQINRDQTSIILNKPSTANWNEIQGRINNITNWAMMLGESTENNAGFYRYNPANGAYIDRPFWLTPDGNVNVNSSLYIGQNLQALRFYTPPGGVNTGYALNVQAYADGGPGDKYGQVLRATDGIGTAAEMYCRHLSGQLAYWQWNINGQIYTMHSNGQGSSAGGWVSTSDFRVKYDNKPITDALAKVSRITGYTGIRQDQFLPDNMHEHPRRAHVFAQDVLDVLPEAVIVPPSYDRATNTGDLLALDHNGVIALLVQAVKELDDKVRALQPQAGST